MIPDQGPTIVQDDVRPAANVYLTALPPGGSFVVPVRVSDPNQSITCSVFVDFDTGGDNNEQATGLAARCPVTLPALGDGGLTGLSFTLSAASFGDPTLCHVIQCFVADDFKVNSAHTPDGLADSVTWQYAPNGPGGCSQFDAGDGAFPPDAPPDALPLTPGLVGEP